MEKALAGLLLTKVPEFTSPDANERSDRLRNVTFQPLLDSAKTWEF